MISEDNRLAVRIFCMECLKEKTMNNLVLHNAVFDICKECYPKFKERKKKQQQKRQTKFQKESDPTWMIGDTCAEFHT